jgi:hypothetical protein
MRSDSQRPNLGRSAPNAANECVQMTRVGTTGCPQGIDYRLWDHPYVDVFRSHKN